MPEAPRSPDTAIAIAFLLFVLLALGGAVVRNLTRRRDRKTRLTRELAELGGPSAPRYCLVCGAPAECVADRTGEKTFVDDLFPFIRQFSLRARYRPATPKDGVKTLCALHVRSYNARLRVKAIEVADLAEANADREAAEALAKYEGGDLLKELSTTLNPDQTRAKKQIDAQRTKPSGVATAVIASPEAGVASGPGLVAPAAWNPGGIAPEAAFDGVPPAMQGGTVPASSASPVPPLPGTTVRPPAAEGAS